MLLLALVLLLELADELVTTLLALVSLVELVDENITTLLAMSSLVLLLELADEKVTTLLAMSSLVLLLELADEKITTLLALVSLVELVDENITSLLAVSLANSSVARARAVAKVTEAVVATVGLVVGACASLKTENVTLETSSASDTGVTDERVPEAEIVAASDVAEAAKALTELGTGIALVPVRAMTAVTRLSVSIGVMTMAANSWEILDSVG